MLSFIVIGRNEGWKLNKCLTSIFETIEYNKLDAEVIYVDTKSTDGSIELAKTFQKVKVFLITGECNAAIARNIGAKESRGDILFFIDGDMEINKKFLPFAIINNQLKYDCVTGHLDDYLYDYNDNFLGVKNRTYTKLIPTKEQVLKTNGGIFLIKKTAWKTVGGMRTKYKVNEDIDLTMRLAKKGIKTIRLPLFIAKHYTVDYRNEKRMWQNIKHFYSFYPAMIFRDHIFNNIALKRILRTNYSALLLFALIISLIINIQWLYLSSAILYFLFFMAKVVKNSIDASISKSKVVYFLKELFFNLCMIFYSGLGSSFFIQSPKV